MGPGLGLRPNRDDNRRDMRRSSLVKARSTSIVDPFGRTYWVYILASRKHGTLYVGMTSDLPGRVYEHREGLTPGFTSRYGVRMLVYFESFGIVEDAIAREKQLKRWRRDWKINLIERSNPEWADLFDGIFHQMR
jgi:putative endonuclease